METLEDIWAGDLFDRRREADDLVGYLESVAGRPAIREDGHAHVLAIDTAYGNGKTFFLRRLDRHLRTTEHVSAYIDAWVDDLEDQPLVALAATLDQALEPWSKKHQAVASGLATFKSKAGKVAKIVGVGLAKRGAGFLITQGAAEALGDELAKASEGTKDRVDESLKDAGTGFVDNVAVALKSEQGSSMDARIARFREGQQAVRAMRESLADVVNALAAAGMKLPITIIVDELDRCRPTYAIKTLEEIKHLFDVQGVAFVLGMHGKQLEHSVTSAYGQKFDAGAYLRRFFTRRYLLKPVSLKPLIDHLMSLLGIDERLIVHPSVVRHGAGRPVNLTSSELIADYIQAYGLAARDAYGLMESLYTATALTGGSSVQLAYLMPLIIANHTGSDLTPKVTREPTWTIGFGSGQFSNDLTTFTVNDFVKHLHDAAQLTDGQLSSQVNANDIFARIVVDAGFRNGSKSYSLLQNYPELIRTVSRFS